jgi:hypothetical protein
MATEVWFRNPDNYIRELVECGSFHVAWDRGVLVKKSIDPLKHAELYFGPSYPYRVLLVGEQGTSEYGPDSTSLNKPVAVYPTWEYGEDSALLEEIVALPVGQDPRVCFDLTVPSDVRPVLGQEHRVVIINPPLATTGPGRHFLRYLKELQEEYPNCIIHIHGLYGWKVAFGMGFRSADIDPRTPAQKGKVTVPAGREMKFEDVARNPQWCTVLGFKPTDLAVPRNRCMYNIKSAEWAGKNYDQLVNFRVKSSSTKDLLQIDTPESDYTPASGTSVSLRGKKAGDGDQVLCNTCSLQLDCKYYREGAVCSVPGAEPAPLARFFKTRDSSMIIDGLGVIMAAQTRRLERGMEEEEVFGELSPEVTKLLNSLFDQGVKLAKLVDPALRGSTKVGVFVNGQPQQQQSNDPRQFVAGVIRELRARGIPDKDITPELIQSTLGAMVDAEKSNRAIEGTVVRVDEPDEKAS